MTKAAAPISAPARQQMPRSRPAPPVSARALAAAEFFHAPLAGRGEDNHQPRPGRVLERHELDDGAQEST